MSVAGVAFTAANSAVFLYTVQSGETRQEGVHVSSYTASNSVHLKIYIKSLGGRN